MTTHAWPLQSEANRTQFTTTSDITLITTNTLLTPSMAIDRDTFEQSSPEELEGLSTAERVLGFLAVNDDRAFKARELARQTDLDAGAVSTALTRLKERDLVEHKGTYWAITTDEERLEAYRGYARATALFNEQFGVEDREEWLAHAPDEPHPGRSEGEG